MKLDELIEALEGQPTGACCHCNSKATVYLTDGRSTLKFCAACASGWARRYGFKEAKDAKAN